MKTHDADVVVIGSGAGGLTAAVALARAGKRVEVFEQHYLPGGWCHSFALEAHQFSPGVHYIGELHSGGMMREIYEGLGVANDLVFNELNPDSIDRVLLGNERFDIPKGRDNFQERVCERFPKEKQGIRDYFSIISGISEGMMSAAKLRGWEKVKMPWKMRQTIVHGLKPLESVLSGLVEDPTLKAILSIQGGDHALPPSRVPTAMHAMIQSHYFNGAWYPQGGAKSLPRAFLRQLKAHGGKLHLSTRVSRILCEGSGRSRRVVGVKLENGDEVRADVVVSNADPHVTFGRLLTPDELSPRMKAKLSRLRYSPSSVSMFFAVDYDIRAAGLDSGNVWYCPTNDMELPYTPEAQGVGGMPNELPFLFLTAPSLKDSTKQKGNVHTLEAFAFASYDAFAPWEASQSGQRPEGYQALTAGFTERILNTIDKVVPGLREHITFQNTGTPLTNTFYCDATRGSVYGIEKTLGNLPPFGFSVKSEINGLWLCGASTLGHGVTGATNSGLVAASEILGCMPEALLNPKGQTLRTQLADAPMQHEVVEAA